MRGQVTGFAIIGVLLLIVVLSVTWLSRPSTSPGPNLGPNLDLESCIEQEMLSAISLIGRNGGVPSTFGGLRSIGTAAGPLGIPSGTQSSISLNPKHSGSIVLHEEEDRTANNYFYAFDHAAPGSTIGSASSTFTSEITTRVEAECRGSADISVASIAYSDTSTTLRARVIEDDRSPRDVTVTTPLPIRRYHQALHHALRRENREPTFPLRSYPSPDFTLMMATMANNDTVVMLETDRPLLGQEPFRYLTIIENRPPVYTQSLEGILSCDGTTSTPSINNPGGDNTVQGLITSGILIDPDDLHELTIPDCSVNGDTYAFTIESGGKTYTLEVPQ